MHYRKSLLAVVCGLTAAIGAQADELADPQAGEIVVAQAGEVTDAQAGEVADAQASEIVVAQAGEIADAQAGETVVAQADGTAGAPAGGFARAQLGEIYGSIGLPGITVGYAYPVNESFTVRGDLSTAGTYTYNGTRSGIAFTGKAKLDRVGVFADWFAFGNGFRFTGGLTYYDASIKLRSRAQPGDIITIGGVGYPIQEGDRFDVNADFPRVTPYLGIGWGHRAGDKGWGFTFDLGASIGRAKLHHQLNGQLANEVAQPDIDRQMASFRHTVNKVQFIPQVSIGVSYRF